MRILHTADWHLGRIFQGGSLVEDQAYVLDSFIEQVKETQPDAVIIAGDVYDRAVPPPDAVSLLNKVLTEISVELRVPILCIAGNHDSPDRLQIWGKVLREHQVHLEGRLKFQEPVVIFDEWGPVSFHLVPFAEAGTIKEKLRAKLQFEMNKNAEEKSSTLSQEKKLNTRMHEYLERIGKNHGSDVSSIPFLTGPIKRGQVTLAALESLAQGGRLVVVVSHVDELKERILSRLEVSGGALGSGVRFYLPDDFSMSSFVRSS